MTIHEVIDPVRGCGKRKPGGLYLVAGDHSQSCCALPLPLTVCPCCGQGIKFFRGFGWIDPVELFQYVQCVREDFSIDEKIDQVIYNQPRCLVENFPPRIGLMWVGEQFYTPNEFTREAAAVGVSKRIASIPNDFVIGKTWLALAHKKAVPTAEGFAPGVFMFFRPSRIEYVLQGNETVEFLERLEKRGVTLVRVVGHVGEQIPLINE